MSIIGSWSLAQFSFLLLLVRQILQLTDAFCPDVFKEKDACTCLSYLDGAVIRCKGPEAPYIIEKLKTESVVIRELAIEDADIIEIGPRAFRNMKISSLILDNNRIRALHKDAFVGLERSLVSLSVAHNKLTEIPTDALANLQTLQVLNLKCNNIGNIYTSALHNLTSLIELNLACNQICKIAGSAFEPIKTTLQSLILDDNCLREVPAEALRNFNNLLALHLQNNNIETIEKLQLMNMVSLLMVRLSYNKIKSVDRYGFNNIPHLRYLFLDHNELAVLEPNVLQQFQFLEIADLSYNSIAEIPAGAFQRLEHLLQLNLEGNAIRDIAPNAFAQTPLLLLLLGHNCLTGIGTQVFTGVPFLRQISLAHNNIKNLEPFAFAAMPNLQLLDLSNNKLDSIFPATLTPNFASTVILSENPVVCGPNAYHVIKGGSPILLLNEPNHICSMFNRTRPDKCPTRKPKSPPLPCCSRPEKHSDENSEISGSPMIQLTTPNLISEITTTTITSTTASPAVAVSITVPSTVQPLPHNGNMTSSITASPFEQMAAERELPSTPRFQAQENKVNKPKTPNMARFWRFTRPPSEPLTATLKPIIQGMEMVKKVSNEKQPQQNITSATTTLPDQVMQSSTNDTEQQNSTVPTALKAESQNMPFISEQQPPIYSNIHRTSPTKHIMPMSIQNAQNFLRPINQRPPPVTLNAQWSAERRPISTFLGSQPSLQQQFKPAEPNNSAPPRKPLGQEDVANLNAQPVRPMDLMEMNMLAGGLQPRKRPFEIAKQQATTPAEHPTKAEPASPDTFSSSDPANAAPPLPFSSEPFFGVQFKPILDQQPAVIEANNQQQQQQLHQPSPFVQPIQTGNS
ncbi:Leucine-rich repeat-containing protein let-4 [Trichinella pseudospiralis]|uniref:Leucine-rich repeat-containing protein let-4 n=1 Tax=Trichinella pseudospiralis TaxID=6337 RepID=A0A0V1G253_TRIPS|nr:Leucine-rich repeat-containing protein let-4 [Trichinella pseudospiralis]